MVGYRDTLSLGKENFPSWEPKIQGLGVPATQGLLWDPLGLQGDLSPVSDLLFNKMAGEKQLHPRTNSTAFDKWSWSTTATEADSTLPPLQEEQGSRLKRVVFELLKTARRCPQESSPTGVGSGKTSETEPEASQASQVQEEQPLLSLHPPLPPSQQLPITSHMPVQMSPVPLPLPPHMQLQQQVAVMPMQAPQPPVMVPVPMPQMPMGMGILPVVMSPLD
eukprot:g3317.t1